VSISSVEEVKSIVDQAAVNMKVFIKQGLVASDLSGKLFISIKSLDKSIMIIEE